MRGVLPRRRSVVLPAVLLTLAFGSWPTAADPGHAHGGEDPGIVLVSDLASDGFTRVGGLNHFTILSLGDGTEPQFHQDVPYRVTHNGVVVLETDATSGHDYDGVQSFDVAFFQPGPFEVQALGREGDVAASFTGMVTSIEGTGGEGFSGALNPVELGPRTMEYHWDETERDGRPLELDLFFDVRRDGRLVAHNKLHGAGAISFDYPVDGAGSFSTWAHTYDGQPDPEGHQHVPIGQVFTFSMPAAGLGSVHLPVDIEARAPAEANAVVHGTSPDGPYRIIGTYDPWTEVGPDTLMHLAVLVVDDQGHPARDVAFEAELQDGLGRRLSGSADLFEYDGILEWSVMQAKPGLYNLAVTATAQDWSGEIDVPYVVAAPADTGPGSAGQVTIALEAPSSIEALRTVPFVIDVKDGSGAPLVHSEAVVEVIGPAFLGHVVHHSFKVHTHDGGRMPFQLAFQKPGTYDVRVHVSPLEARPVVIPAAEFSVNVDEAPAPATDEDRPDAAMPASGPVLVLVALVVLAGVAGRRRN